MSCAWQKVLCYRRDKTLGVPNAQTGTSTATNTSFDTQIEDGIESRHVLTGLDPTLSQGDMLTERYSLSWYVRIVDRVAGGLSISIPDLSNGPHVCSAGTLLFCEVFRGLTEEPV